VRRSGNSVEVEGPVDRGFSVDLTPAPDLYPLAGVLAASIPGARSTLRGAPQLESKESDRRAGTLGLVRALGASAQWSRLGQSMEIRGAVTRRPLRLSALRDHRVLASATVAALAARGASRVGPAESIRKSYPQFWTDLRAIGAHLRRVR
jgi:3-phosphoshikimate 1-carboxyvinyltransferase